MPALTMIIGAAEIAIGDSVIVAGIAAHDGIAKPVITALFTIRATTRVTANLDISAGIVNRITGTRTRKIGDGPTAAKTEDKSTTDWTGTGHPVLFIFTTGHGFILQDRDFMMLG